MSLVQKNFENILQTIRTHSPDPKSVRLLGAAKKQPIDRIREAIGVGLYILGNNYAQDGDRLRTFFPEPFVKWHFIGHIQSRKTKELLSYDCIQTLERIEVATKLNQLLKESNKKLSVLVQVNIGKEPQKSGVAPRDLDSLLSEVAKLQNLELNGLMCLSPPLEPVEKRRPFFKEMKTLFENYRSKYPFHTLSMGTSDDYAIALEEGSTLVRLGTTLFGERNQPT